MTKYNIGKIEAENSIVGDNNTQYNNSNQVGLAQETAINALEKQIEYLSETQIKDKGEILSLLNDLYNELSEKEVTDKTLFEKIKSKIEFLGAVSETISIVPTIKEIIELVKKL